MFAEMENVLYYEFHRNLNLRLSTDLWIPSPDLYIKANGALKDKIP